MVSVRAVGSSRVLGRSATRRRRARWRTPAAALRRRVLRSDSALLALLVTTTLLALPAVVEWPRYVPPSSFAVVVLGGAFLLSVRPLLVLFAVVAMALAATAVAMPSGAFPPGAVGIVAAACLLGLGFARSRSRLGVHGTRGETMLVDLRDRLTAQGEMPALPPGWQAEIVLRSAHGASFSGDFLVATRSSDGATVEVVLVDVSGKGLDAGTRSLLLSGAFGGLLGAMPAAQFLPAANAYLLRQRWGEGFATAAHLVVDLASGDYTLMMAGHPPAAHFAAGSGRWRLVDLPEGPVLGILPEAKYGRQTGRLGRGDALLLYTDGLIETPGRDLWVGIDRLLGEAERLVTKGFRHGAHKLVDQVGAGEDDDRALVLLWRD